MRAEDSSSIPHRASYFIASLLDLLYPPRCRSCREPLLSHPSDCFCARCWEKIRLATHPLCPLCGRPFLDTGGDDHLCGVCIARRPRFTRARAWACYTSDDNDRHPLRDVVQRFKYGRKVSLGKPLGRLMAIGCREAFVENQPDLLIPVPLHPKRLRWRGFNQSVVLAREVSRIWNLPMDPTFLVRAKETPPQTQLSEEDRRKNVRDAFALNPAKSVEGKTVLLVDDIYTSGATVNACSRALLGGGVKEVQVLTLARTV